MISNVCRPGLDLELKVHDGIIGVVNLSSVGAGVMVDPAWFWLTGVVAVAMIGIAVTGFCPLHFVLSKVMPAAN